MDIWADGKVIAKDKSLATILLNDESGAGEPTLRIDNDVIILENISIGTLTQKSEDGKTTIVIRTKEC